MFYFEAFIRASAEFYHSENYSIAASESMAFSFSGTEQHQWIYSPLSLPDAAIEQITAAHAADGRKTYFGAERSITFLPVIT